MAISVAAACWTGLAVALTGCGLAVNGGAPDLGPEADGAMGTYASSSSSGSGGSGGGQGADSSSAFDGSLSGDDGGSSAGDSPALGPSFDASADSRAPQDAGRKDASAVDAASYCPQLTACCNLLASYMVSASTVSSCLAGAATNNSSTCLSVLLSIQSVGICL